MKRVHRPTRRRALFEPLERRQLLAAVGSSALAADLTQLVFGDVAGDAAASAPRTVTFSNTGAAPLTIPADGISIAGPSAAQFQITAAPASQIVLAPGASVAISVTFAATALGSQGAILQIGSDDPTNPTTSLDLRGLGTKGEQGDLEPSLQWILDTYQIAAHTGDSDPAEATLDLTPLDPNDEVLAPLFTKAGTGPVSIVPIAVYSNAASPALTLGYYTRSATSTSITKKSLYTVPSPDVQTLNPRVTGTSSFDPGSATFGLYSTWAAQNNRTVYSEDFRNTFISTASLRRMFRVYPLTTADGTIVPNAYVIGNEEAYNHDYQDAVYIIRNVTPAQSFPVAVPVAVTGLVLVNADTGKDIGPLTDGQTIDLTQIGTSRLSVRALVAGAPGSVKFVDGSFSHVENSAPYTINGDSGLTYTPWTAPLGANTLTVTPYNASNASGGSGTAYTVNFTVQNTPAPTTPTPPPTPPPTTVVAAEPVVYHAEKATLTGATVAAANGGYTGSGYADFQNASGDSIRWDVSTAAAGSVNLTFRYANGGTTNRPLSLQINGVTVTPKLAFNATGSWTTWKTVTVTVQLLAGLNSITLTTIGSNGGNFDSLTVG